MDCCVNSRLRWLQLQLMARNILSISSKTLYIPRPRFLPSCQCSTRSAELGSRLVKAENKVLECVCDDQSKPRLDVYLAKMVPTTTRSQICQSIKNGFVRVNNEPCAKPSYSIKYGDSLYFEMEKKIPSTIEAEDIPLSIVYEDDDIIVINKEAGMVVHPSAGHWSGTLVHALMHHARLDPIDFHTAPMTFQSEEISSSVPEEEVVFRPGIVHRLDMGTSGLLVVAKNDWIHARLSEKFKERDISRFYLSFLIGRPREAQGRIETNLDRDLKDRKLQRAIPSTSRKGRRAISNYAVLTSVEDFIDGENNNESDVWSLVGWNLETGRTHQIRAHAKHLGCPIMGDEAYGGNSKLLTSKFTLLKQSRKKLEESMEEFPSRPMLHAQKLSFHHPRTNEHMSFAVDLPADFHHCLAFLDRLKCSE